MRFGNYLRTQGSVALAAALDSAPVGDRYAAHRQSRAVHAVFGTSLFRPDIAYRTQEAKGTRLGYGFAPIFAGPTDERDSWAMTGHAMTPDDSIRIRSATEADAMPLLAIYRPYVETSAVSFETLVPTVEEFCARIQKAATGWQWLVAEKNGQCVGYAYGSAHRERAAYRWSVEVSAYVQPNHHRQGVGRLLYTHLFADLERKGFCNAYAGITLPNEASVALHRSVGFEFIGTFGAVGRKFGKWHDVAWFQRRLRDLPPSEPDRAVSPG